MTKHFRQAIFPRKMNQGKRRPTPTATTTPTFYPAGWLQVVLVSSTMGGRDSSLVVDVEPSYNLTVCTEYQSKILACIDRCRLKHAASMSSRERLQEIRENEYLCNYEP